MIPPVIPTYSTPSLEFLPGSDRSVCAKRTGGGNALPPMTAPAPVIGKVSEGECWSIGENDAVEGHAN